ncbi:MAG: ABC transporter ATP-binding protein [bacterium]|nr:ABC transporter ATP-binding protein [bacterium]
MDPVIQVKNIRKVYKTGNDEEFVALNDISFSIFPGEFVSIIGPSGSGKSTLMHIIGLLDTPTSGEIYVDGNLITSSSQAKLAQIRNRKIGFVFQAFNLLKKTKAVDNVALPLIYAGVSVTKQHEMAKIELELVGLGDRLNNMPSQLSGGQQQRVAIARALVTNPTLILADEPTGNLDSKSGIQIMQLFRDLNKKGKTIVIVTHDKNIASQTNRSINIMDGNVESDVSNQGVS